MLRLGWFSTGRGPGSRNLLKTVMDGKLRGELDIEIPFVFCNWDNTEEPNPKKEQREMFFKMVGDYGIPLIAESWKKHDPALRKKDEAAWRDSYGALLREKTGMYGFDLGILAGYMLWMDDTTCSEYDMLNLHPALPDGPKGTWEEVIWTLIRERAIEQGAMMHICTSEWDRGDALTYCGFPITGGDYSKLWEQLDRKLETKTLNEIMASEGTEEPLFKRIREDGAKREQPLIVETIKLFANGEVSIRGKRLYRDGRKLDGPYDLSTEVNEVIRNG